MEELIFAIVVLGMAAIGGLLVITARRAREAEFRPVSQHLVRLLRCLAWVLIAVAAGVSALMLTVCIVSIAEPDFPAIVMTFAAFLVFSLLIASVGLCLFRVAKTLAHREVGPFDSTIERRLSIISFAGWSQIVLASLSLIVPGPLLLLAGLIAINILGTRHYTRQGTLLWVLAISIEKGLPLPEELEAFATTVKGRFRRQVLELAKLLRGGMPLSAALERLPRLLPARAVMAIQIGTNSGMLPQALRDTAIAHTSQHRDRFFGHFSFGGSIMYLFIVFIVANVILSFQMYYIIPKFKAIFEGFGTELPNATILLIELSNFAVNYWFIVFPAMLAPFVFLLKMNAAYYWGSESFLPGFLQGRFFRFSTPPILRNLARVVIAQRPLAVGLEEIAACQRQPRVKERLMDVLAEVTQGENCWTALQTNGFLRESEWALLRAAERVGNLPWALRMIADGLERRQTNRVLACAELIQPAVILVLGCCVGFIVYAIFLPLIKLLNDLS